MNFKMISYILGWILIFESLFMIVPSVTAVCYGESALWYFLVTAAAQYLRRDTFLYFGGDTLLSGRSV